MAFSGNNGSYDRRRYPRYYVTSRVTLAIEDESLNLRTSASAVCELRIFPRVRTLKLEINSDCCCLMATMRYR